MSDASISDIINLSTGSGKLYHLADAGNVTYDSDPYGYADSVACARCGSRWFMHSLASTEIPNLFGVGEAPPTSPTETVYKLYWDNEVGTMMTRPLTPEERADLDKRELEETIAKGRADT